MAEIEELEELLDKALGNEKFIRAAFFSAATAAKSAAASRVKRAAAAAAAIASDAADESSVTPNAYSDDSEENDRVLYVKGIPSNVDNDELRDLLETCGEVVVLDRPQDSTTGEGPCYAIVRFANAESARAAEDTLNGVTLGAASLQLGKLGVWTRLAQPDDDGRTLLAQPNKDGTVIQIRFLEASIGDAELTATYQAFGALKSATVARDINTGLSLGYGIVQFVDAAAAKAAVAATHGKLNYPLPPSTQTHLSRFPLSAGSASTVSSAFFRHACFLIFICDTLYYPFFAFLLTLRRSFPLVLLYCRLCYA